MSENKKDMKALFKIGYGLYVVTSNDGTKDNGLIVNTVMQVTSSPERVAVAINNMPSSVIPKPIKPIMLKIAKPFFECASSLFFTARKTNFTDKIQFTTNPVQKPNAVAMIKEITFHTPPPKLAGSSH